MDDTRTRYFIVGLLLLIVLGVAIFGYFWWQLSQKEKREGVSLQVNEEELLKSLQPAKIPEGFETKATPEEKKVLESLKPAPIKQQTPAYSGESSAVPTAPSLGTGAAPSIPGPTKEEQDLLQLLKPSE